MLYSFVLRALVVSVLAFASTLGCASSVTVQVTDTAGQALADAAVYAEPAAGQAAQTTHSTAEVEQRGKKFSPLVTVVQIGTDVMFPNNDTVRHHVYSFSPAKIFDIKLYSGAGETKNFDKAGTVILGCNIHDQMVGYIHVVNTPYFAKTDASGKVMLKGLAPGKYQLKAWHYNLPAGAAIPEQTINVTGAEISSSFKLATKGATTH